jgi:phosphatidylglycerophosphate synthase
MNATRRMAAIQRKLLALTLGRLLLIPFIILSLGVVPAVTFSALVVFILLDLYDGVAARRLGGDDVARRILDSVVDRVSIWSVYAAATQIGLLPLSLLLILAARDLYCGYWCYRLITERDIAIKADWLYRSLNLALAGWIIVAPLVSAGLRLNLFLAVCIYSVVVAIDLRRSIGIALSLSTDVSSRVIPASVLRTASSQKTRPVAAPTIAPLGPV